MPKCSVYGCTNRENRDGVTLHRFPKNPVIREKWVCALRRANFTPSKSAVICSSHFHEDDMDRTSLSCVRVRTDSVPTIFSALPSYLQTSSESRGIVKQHQPTHSTEGPLMPLEPFPHTDNIVVPEQYETPQKRELKRKLVNTENKLCSTRKRIKVLMQSKRRLVKKNAALKNVINDLQKNGLMGSGSLSVLETSAGGVADLLKRQASKKLCKSLPATYSPELRSFALTLHFYSPKAYRYVRKVFNTCLPHPRTIERWYSSVDGKPGFTSNSFRALEVHAKVAAVKDKKVVYALMVDEVAIRQQIDWDGTRYYGYIDIGTQIDDDTLPAATQALTFMVVAINDNFKLPVGYFLIEGLDGMARANLVNTCIEKLHSANVCVVSLTCDGASSNLAMAKCLGCKFEYLEPNFKTSFPHPVSTEPPVSFFLDACHMLKLIRNTFAEKKSLVDGENKLIDFAYIEKLHKLQQDEGLHLANKLRSAHLAWRKKKMNVKLAAQLLSSSVADSLEFCLKERIPGFENCEATVKFIRIFNDLFDVLNSRSLFSRGCKRPLQRSNESDVRQFVSKCQFYIASLKEARNGKNLINSTRKTGFIGFLICMNSMLQLYDRLILSDHHDMTFLCTFKVSQDHLELFFGKIRSLGGCNNNPSAQQFCSAYKRLLVHNDIEDVVRGNCLPLQSVPILTVSSSSHSNSSLTTPSVTELNASVSRSRIIEPEPNEFDINDHDYTYIPNRSILSRCGHKIVAYIAGFVVYKLSQTLHCEACIGGLCETEDSNVLCSLVKQKSRGGLIFPSEDVVDICITCEKYFRLNVTIGSGSLSRVLCHELIQSVLASYLSKDIFRSLSENMLDCDPMSNHLVLLIKSITEQYRTGSISLFCQAIYPSRRETES